MNDLSFASRVIFDKKLSEISTIGIGGNARAVMMPEDADQLINDIRTLKKMNIKYLVVGACSNILFPDNGFDGAIIMVKGGLNYIEEEKGMLIAGAGTKLSAFVEYCADKEYRCAEKGFGIPGTIGGCIKSNAGAYGWEISDNLKKITCFDGSIVKKLYRSEIEFGYRYTNIPGIILEACFTYEKGIRGDILNQISKIKQSRKEKHPLNEKSLGSVFKNPKGKSAGELIDKCGLKGRSVGGAEVSEKHGNFIINAGGASQDDVLKLIDIIKKEVRKKFEVELEREIIVIQ